MGSGIYPKEEADGGGCVIARADNTPRDTIFNLFLITAVLFLPALWKNRSRKKTVMKSREKGTIFVCALALLVFFSGASPAGAHEGSHDHSITTANVKVTDMESVKAFVLHAKAHWESITTPNDNISFEKSLSVDGGDWKDGTTYLVVIDDDAVFTQPHYPLDQNAILYSSSTTTGPDDGVQRMLLPDVQALINAAGMEGGGCVQNDEGQYGCAVKFMHPVWKDELILIGGFHYDQNDVRLSFEEIDCPYFVEIKPESPYFFQGTTADKVVDDNTLREFVEQFATHFEEQVELAGRSFAGLARVRNCWRILPWKHEGIYVFIMTEDQLVFFNGNTPRLENGTLDVEDDNNCRIGDEIVRVLNGGDEARQCKSLGLLPEDSEGFVEYLWDDPTDDIPPVVAEGMSPGDVPKLSYVERVHLPALGENFIIGSGFHPEVGGDGCAIAGTGSTAKSVLFNLLLIVSVLFSAALWKNRSIRKQKQYLRCGKFPALKRTNYSGSSFRFL